MVIGSQWICFLTDNLLFGDDCTLIDPPLGKRKKTWIFLGSRKERGDALRRRVLAYMGEWLPVAMAVGLAGAFLVFALVRRPVACSLFGVLGALAAVQVLFLVL